MEQLTKEILQIIDGKSDQDYYFALYPNYSGVTLEIRNFDTPQRTLWIKKGLGIWRVRNLIIELSNLGNLSKEEIEYLIFRADEIIMENYSHSTAFKWFNKKDEYELKRKLMYKEEAV